LIANLDMELRHSDLDLAPVVRTGDAVTIAQYFDQTVFIDLLRFMGGLGAILIGRHRQEMRLLPLQPNTGSLFGGLVELGITHLIDPVLPLTLQLTPIRKLSTQEKSVPEGSILARGIADPLADAVLQQKIDVPTFAWPTGGWI